MTDLSANYGPSRSAPQALEAEEAVLGCILISPETYLELASFLKADDFYLHKHRWVWEAMVRLHDQRLSMDTLTLTEELERHNQLAEIGGTAFLARLLTAVPTSLHAEAYGRIVEREATRRRLMGAATTIAKLAAEEDRDINAVINDAQATLFAVSQRQLTRDLKPLADCVAAYYDRLHTLSPSGELRGVPTGFTKLDAQLGGLQKSDLILVAARPGVGKTSFLLGAAKHAAQTHRKNVALFSLEMGHEQLTQRLIAQETGLDAHSLRLADVRDDEWPLIAQAAGVLAETPIFIDDTPGLTPTQLRAKCRRFDQEQGLDLVIVDYLQLMNGGQRFENRAQEVAFISRQLKELARELNVPVLAASQLSRAVEQRADKRPMLSDLKESGGQEQDADVVIFLHRPDDDAGDGATELTIAKHRNGPLGAVTLFFCGAQTQFLNAETRPPEGDLRHP